MTLTRVSPTTGNQTEFKNWANNPQAKKKKKGGEAVDR